eukprot:Hpha_TRINITY_DN14836_c0_g2::TRINITY_DN14836_c0_g2_i1::g.169894::m.169894
MTWSRAIGYEPGRVLRGASQRLAECETAWEHQLAELCTGWAVYTQSPAFVQLAPAYQMEQHRQHRRQLQQMERSYTAERMRLEEGLWSDLAGLEHTVVQDFAEQVAPGGLRRAVAAAPAVAGERDASRRVSFALETRRALIVALGAALRTTRRTRGHVEGAAREIMRLPSVGGGGAAADAGGDPVAAPQCYNSYISAPHQPSAV